MPSDDQTRDGNGDDTNATSSAEQQAEEAAQQPDELSGAPTGTGFDQAGTPDLSSDKGEGGRWADDQKDRR